MDRGARGAGTADVPLGTAPVAAVPAAPRSSPLSAIGVYIASTHVVLVVAATIAPTVAFVTGTPPPGAAITGIAIAALVAALGGLALLSEAMPDRRAARLWQRTPAAIAWGVALVAGSAVLAAVTPGGAGTVSAAAFAIGLALRAIATGSFWARSLRIVVGSALVLGVLLLSGAAPGPDPVLTVALGALLAFAITGQDAVYALALEVDDLRAADAERAVGRERRRFAGDLHDIQGQHLQLLAVEARLVQRLIDAGRHDDAREHAARMGRIAATALDEMRDVVHASRPVSVETEAANAARVLESAGIAVEAVVDVGPALPAVAARLLGLAIREGTTNVLRHTRADRCRLVVRSETRDGRDGVAVILADSGPAAAPTGPAGTGLATLARRCSDAGGRLAFTAVDGGRLDAWLPLVPEGRGSR